MSDNKYNIEDIVKFSSDDNPLNVKNAVDNLMIAKIQSEIQNKKLEVAKTLFGGTDEDSEYDEEDNEYEDDDEYDLDISDEDLADLLADLNDLDYAEDEDNTDLEDTNDGEDA
jgi:hypothetical protein